MTSSDEGPGAPVETPIRPPATHDDGHPRDEELERSFDRIVIEGRYRLHRSLLDLLATGATAGIEVALGVLALLEVDRATGDDLLGALAFSIGFIGLYLGRSELFTEGFLVPVTVVAAGEARLRDLLKMWLGTLVGNLAGGALSVLLVVKAFPELHAEAVSTASHYLETGVGVRSFCLAALAGAAITLLTRMHNGTDSDGARLLASVAVAFLLAGTRLFHSVLDSLLAFAALEGGRARFGVGDWFVWFCWVAFGNVVGGLGLTTLLRLVRSRQRLADHRVAASEGRRRPEGDQAG